MASFGVYCLKIVTLETKVPTLNSGWWLGIWVVDNQLNGLAISEEFKMASKQINV